MKRALIDPRHNRVAQVVDPAAEREFSVAPPLFWMDCDDECVADDYEYVDGTIRMSERHPQHPKRIAEEARAKEVSELRKLRRKLLDQRALGHQPRDADLTRFSTLKAKYPEV